MVSRAELADEKTAQGLLERERRRGAFTVNLPVMLGAWRIGSPASCGLGAGGAFAGVLTIR